MAPTRTAAELLSTIARDGEGMVRSPSGPSPPPPLPSHRGLTPHGTPPTHSLSQAPPTSVGRPQAELFARLDCNGDGDISRSECQQRGVAAADIEAIRSLLRD